ncbi:MAG: family 20 glycosylhydrolase, partial [Steroidobacteraceae bacterium]
ASAAPGPSPDVIPRPLKVASRPGIFVVGAALTVIVPPSDPQARATAASLRDLLAGGRPALLPLTVKVGAAQDGALVLRRLEDAALGAEGYRLSVTPQRIEVAANAPAGWLYGGITLWQLVRGGGPGPATVDAQLIEDQPRLKWRGLMLDSARHFQSPAFIARLIDWMALHKLNVLHWHLTDDQGWRIQILKYPRLTSVGAWRIPAGGATRYGGFYTQAQIRKLVALAVSRNITVVPEIDVPGHASAAIASYPALGVKPDEVRAVPADWGVFKNVFAPTAASCSFLEDVLSEVLDLFPGPYIHLGGDEVPAQGTPAVDVHACLARFVTARGRRVVGWDETLTPDLPRSAIVMSWRGLAGARAASAQGNDTVLAPDPQLYFDHRQGLAAWEPPGRLLPITLHEVYEFEPLAADLSGGQRAHVLGLQGNVWTEHVRSEQRVAAMAFPRLAAVAEVGWSEPSARNWPDFERRMAVQLRRYRQLGLPYDESLFGVEGRVDYSPDAASATVTLSHQADFGDIRYTTDGAVPDARSTLYSGPFKVAPGALIVAATFAQGSALSGSFRWQTYSGLAGRRSSVELSLCGAAVPLALESGASRPGPRAIFAVDIENPCWIWKAVNLKSVGHLVAAVGRVPFNFQIGADRERIHFAPPTTAAGELLVHLDTCEGALYARLPLAPAGNSSAVTVLPAFAVQPVQGVHDLCLQFAQRGPDPLWLLDWLELHSP